jgi:glycosyltransferase involved in cell wall biosynthesis
METATGSVASRREIVVAICTYNNAPLLDQVLCSLEAQVVPPDLAWNIVVVDNNCTDNTRSVVIRHQGPGNLSNLDLVPEPRQGLSHARRRAVAATDAAVIAFVDDDCRLAPDWVAEAALFFRDHPRAGLLGGRVELVWETSPDPWLLEYGGSFAQQDHGPTPVKFASEGVIRLVGAGFVCRREALEASGWLGSSALVGRQGNVLSAGEDLEISLKIRQVGYEAWYTPRLRLEHFITSRRMQPQYVCRLHRGFGQARVPLHFIEKGESPTMARRLRALGYSLKDLLRLAASTALPWPGRHGLHAKVALYEALGTVEGAWGMLKPRFSR